MENLIWYRFVREEPETADGEEAPIWELARDGATLLIRKLGGKKRARTESKWLASVERAERALKREMRALTQQGYREDGTVTRPAQAPQAPRPRRQKPSSKASQWEEARQTFDAQLPAFVQGWRALGFNETLDFDEQCRGTQRRPNEVAQSCLALAERTFGVGFARRTRLFDFEHGRSQFVSDRELALLYSSPVCVLTIVYARLRGDIWATDDADLPGFADECMQRLRRLSQDA